MPQFRGIQQDRILDSLRRADSFLKAFGIDKRSLPAQWSAPHALQQIARAKSDAELLRALRETYTCEFLQPLQPFFAHYAHAEESGKAFRLYQDLASWGGFDLFDNGKPHGFPAALSAIIVADAVKTMKPDDLKDGSDAHLGLKKAFCLRARKNQGFNHARETLTIKFIAAAQNKPGSDVQAEFLAMDRGQQKFIRDALHHMKAHDLRQVLLEDLSPIARYCLVVENVPPCGGQSFIAQALKPVMSVLSECLMPFERRGEMVGRRLGMFDQQTTGGYVFMATRDAAQALADRLPRCRVIDQLQKRVMPPPQTPSYDVQAPS